MERPQPTKRGAAGVVGPPEGRAPQKLRLQGPLQAVWKDKGLWGARPSPETSAGRRKGRAGLRVHRGVELGPLPPRAQCKRPRPTRPGQGQAHLPHCHPRPDPHAENTRRCAP